MTDLVPGVGVRTKLGRILTLLRMGNPVAKGGYIDVHEDQNGNICVRRMVKGQEIEKGVIPAEKLNSPVDIVCEILGLQRVGLCIEECELLKVFRQIARTKNIPGCNF
ncbi:MAG: hypothetical protein WBA85_06600 [Brucella anthropi]|nr:hypothetical protein [Brucella anthropi]